MLHGKYELAVPRYLSFYPVVLERRLVSEIEVRSRKVSALFRNIVTTRVLDLSPCIDLVSNQYRG